MNRNFVGYGKEKPKLLWPEDNKVAVSFVVNIEEGAELSISSGDNENEYVSTDYVLKRHDGRWSLYQKASDVEMLRSQSLEPDITKNTKWNWIHRGEKTTEMTINFRIN